jgi:hypothetical protein
MGFKGYRVLWQLGKEGGHQQRHGDPWRSDCFQATGVTDPDAVDFDVDASIHHKPFDVDQEAPQKLCLANREHVPLALSGHLIGEPFQAPIRRSTLHPELKMTAGLLRTQPVKNAHPGFMSGTAPDANRLVGNVRWKSDDLSHGLSARFAGGETR